MKGIEFIDSISVNLNKLMLINLDAGCLWVKDKYILIKALSVDPFYLQYKEMSKTIDYRNWSISLSRRFRSLKIWFTIRSYGIEGIQKHIRNHVYLAKEFAKLVASDQRFEIIGKVDLGLVCFRLKGSDVLSKHLLSILNESGDIHMTPTLLNDKYVIRFCVNTIQAKLSDIQTSWHLISQAVDKIYLDYYENKPFVYDLFEFKEKLSIIRLSHKYFTRIVSEPIQNAQECSMIKSSSTSIDMMII